MKRSEAIKLIGTTIESCYPNPVVVPTYVCDAILESLERHGMLPPPISVSDPGHFPGDNFTYEANEWESE